MTTETITISTDCFDELGVPAELSNYVAGREYPKRYRKRFWLFLSLLMVVMVGLFALVFWGNFVLLEYLEQIRVARLEQPYQYHQEPGPSLVLLLFVAVTALGPIACVMTRGMTRDFREYATFASLEMGAITPGVSGKLTRAWYRAAYEKLAGLQVAEQLVEIERLTMAMYLKPLLGALLLTAPFIAFDVNDYDLADARGATSSRYFSFTRTTHLWEHAEAVEFGCIVFEKGGMSLDYRVHWPNGHSYNLLRGKPDGRAITLADSVNRSLLAQGVERRHARLTSGHRKGEPKLDPACLPLLTKRYDQEELAKLLALIDPDRKLAR